MGLKRQDEEEACRVLEDSDSDFNDDDVSDQDYDDGEPENNRGRGGRRMRRVWTTGEDRKLKKVLSALGPVGPKTSWSTVAKQIPARSAKQCRDRWTSIAPGIKSREWTPEEDQKLIDLYKEHGSAWVQIAPQFEGRNDNMLKSRFRALCRKGLVKPRPRQSTLKALQSSGQKRKGMPDAPVAPPRMKVVKRESSSSDNSATDSFPVTESADVDQVFFPTFEFSEGDTGPLRLRCDVGAVPCPITELPLFSEETVVAPPSIASVSANIKAQSSIAPPSATNATTTACSGEKSVQFGDAELAEWCATIIE